MAVEVWHLDDGKALALGAVRLMSAKMGDAEAVRDLWLEGAYDRVARVEGSDPEDAWEKTNHIDRAWQENPGVEACVAGARSSSVGDVFVVDGKPLVAAMMGFAPLPEADGEPNPPARKFAGLK